jgi:hypothetical protein
MRALLSLCVTLGVLCFGFLASTPAQATLFRTYVSAGGADGNPCSLTSPCATIAHAVTQTTSGGILSCLDANDYSSGAVPITVSITIDCSQFGSGIGPFSINTAGVTVVIKGGVIFVAPLPGIDFKAGAALFVENVQISNMTDGIIFEPTSLGAKLVVTGSLILSNSGNGIHVKPAAGIQANVTVDHTTLENNANNGFFCDGSAGGACVAVVSNSNVSGNGNNGVQETAAGGSVSVLVDNTSVASNPTGLSATAGTGMLVRRSSIVVNGTGISPSGGGLIFSYGDNTVNANATDGSFSSNIPLK